MLPHLFCRRSRWWRSHAWTPSLPAQVTVHKTAGAPGARVLTWLPRCLSEDLVSIMRLILFWLSTREFPKCMFWCSLCLFWGIFPPTTRRVRLFCRTNCIHIEREEINSRVHKQQSIIEISLSYKKQEFALRLSGYFVYINNQLIDLYFWSHFMLTGLHFSL